MTRPTASAPRQLVLDLTLRPALGAADFVVSDSNEAAVRMIDLWPDWPTSVLVLIGPHGSGKTHLTHVWQAHSQARRILAAELASFEPGPDAAWPLVVEDADRGIGDERLFFHALNLARENGSQVLVTGRTPPAEWPVALPDLASRLQAAPLVRLGPVDDMLLGAVLVKLFSDRQLPATPAAVTHLARNIDRSMASAIAVVEQIDAMLWQRRGGVTRKLASEALAALAAKPDERTGATSHNSDMSAP